MLNHLLQQVKRRKDKIAEVREGFLSFREVVGSKGWKFYQEMIDKKILVIENRLKTDTTLNGEDLKRLQLALQVWYDVNRIPKEIENNAKKGIEK